MDINNVSANEFSHSEQEQIVHYINSGGHLVMMGLEHHLGPGAWADSKLAATLPLNCYPKRHEPVTVLLLIDSSGSMDEEQDEVQDALNAFSSFIAASGIDYRVVLIGGELATIRTSQLTAFDICAARPLASAPIL